MSLDRTVPAVYTNNHNNPINKHIELSESLIKGLCLNS